LPRHPASCSVATTGLANRAGGAVQRAIALLADGSGMADTGFILGPALGVISGVDPRDGKRFVNQLMLAHAGGAASPRLDGWLTIGDHGAGGVVLLDSVEMDELQYPLLVHTRRIESDAEGAGRQRGAPGTRPRAAVAEDVREGWIGREKAREVYAVELDADGAVDEEATAALRAGGTAA